MERANFYQPMNFITASHYDLRGFEIIEFHNGSSAHYRFVYKDDDGSWHKTLEVVPPTLIKALKLKLSKPNGRTFQF